MVRNRKLFKWRSENNEYESTQFSRTTWRTKHSKTKVVKWKFKGKRMKVETSFNHIEHKTALKFVISVPTGKTQISTIQVELAGTTLDCSDVTRIIKFSSRRHNYHDFDHLKWLSFRAVLNTNVGNLAQAFSKYTSYVTTLYVLGDFKQIKSNDLNHCVGVITFNGNRRTLF